NYLHLLLTLSFLLILPPPRSTLFPYTTLFRSLNKEDIYHSFFQTKGKRLHDFIENNKDEKSWKNAFVASSKLGVYGRIDVYDAEEKELIEYKSVVAIAYKGYYYQIWAQYYCLLEMGIPVLKLAFYDFKEKK